MPASLPLRRHGKHIGHVFVLLDGIFVVCEDDATRRAWAAHLEANERLFRVSVKGGRINVDLNDPKANVDFAGIVFTHAGWSPRAAIGNLRVWPEAPLARAVASRLGEILWALRVRSAHDPARAGMLQHADLMALYSPLHEYGSEIDKFGWTRSATKSVKF